MEPFQERVIEERDSLDAKRVALGGFMVSGEFQKLSHGERDRLKYQAGVMRDYSAILDERIRAFQSNTEEKAEPEEVVGNDTKPLWIESSKVVRAEALLDKEKRIKELEWKLANMGRWLDAHQPDVWKRGLLDALEPGEG